MAGVIGVAEVTGGQAIDPHPESEKDNWAHRSAKMRCSSCMWFVSKRGGLGRCRRRAPELGGWPAVFDTDWCGDHKLDETKLEP